MKKYIIVVLVMSFILSCVACNQSEYLEETISGEAEVSGSAKMTTDIEASQPRTSTSSTGKSTSTTEVSTETCIETTISSPSDASDATDTSDGQTTTKKTQSTTPTSATTPSPTTKRAEAITKATTTSGSEFEQAPVIELVIEEEPLTKQQWLDELIRLTNEFRVSQGKKPLQRASEITWMAADIRAHESTISISDIRPNGQDFYTVYNDLGHDPWTFSENIASSVENSVERTFQYFIDYQSAKDFLLNDKFNYLAVGYASTTTQKGYDKHFVVLHLYERINTNGSYNSYTKQQWLDELFRLTNEYRASQGKKPLQKAPAVTWEVANLRADETTIKYEHDRPNGQKYYTAFTDLNTDIPNWCAENINCNHFGDSVQQVFQEWVDSPGHKANILSDNSKYLAIGYATDYYVFSNGSEDKAHFAVQIFH